MLNLFVLVFLGAIISFIFFIINPKYRRKKYLLGSVITFLVSFVVIGVTAPDTGASNENAKPKQEKLKEKSHK